MMTILDNKRAFIEIISQVRNSTDGVELFIKNNRSGAAPDLSGASPVYALDADVFVVYIAHLINQGSALFAKGGRGCSDTRT
jgi:hypothetical protein